MFSASEFISDDITTRSLNPSVPGFRRELNIDWTERDFGRQCACVCVCVWSSNTDSLSTRRESCICPPPSKCVVSLCPRGSLETVRLWPVTEFPAEPKKPHPYLVTHTHTQHEGIPCWASLCVFFFFHCEGTLRKPPEVKSLILDYVQIGAILFANVGVLE